MLVRLLIVAVYAAAVWYAMDGGRTNVPMHLWHRAARILQSLARELGTAGLHCENAAYESAKNGSYTA